MRVGHMDNPAEQIGPYVVERELGRGGMGVVYLAHRQDLQQRVALKVITPQQAGSAAAVERFRREAQAAAGLSTHPGIVGVHDIGESDGRLYLAMDYVEGTDLESLIDAGELTPERSAQLLRQVAEAVHFAHECGILHRDLKPANILIADGEEGRALVTDFGLAAPAEHDADTARLTQSGEILGTPAYMPPEQARGEPCDLRADVYALGATLYECLAGVVPFEAESVYSLLAMIMRDEPKPPSKRVGRATGDLDTITLKCLEKAREDRYQSAGALADDLRRHLEHQPIAARPAGPIERLRKRVRRSPAPFAVGGVMGVILIAVLALFAGREWAVQSAREAEVARLVQAGEAALRESEALEAATVERGRAQARGFFLMALGLQKDEAATTGSAAARAGLAELAKRELLEAEEAADAVAAGAALEELRAYAGPAHAELLAGSAWLTLDTAPSGARVEAFRYEADERGVLVEQPAGDLGTTPLRDVKLPMGSYLLVLRLDGKRDTRYPVWLTRGEHESAEQPVPLHSDAAIGEGYLWIPGGETIFGGDPKAMQGGEREVGWIGGFCLYRREVTMGEYRAFLQALLDRGDREAVAKHFPHSLVPGRRTGWSIRGDRVMPSRFYATDLPATMICWNDAAAYCAWRSTVEGRRVSLPHSREWVRAARGADARAFPWGDGFDFALLVSGKSPIHQGRALPKPVEAVPGDVSPFGVHDLAGNLKEWCGDRYAAVNDWPAIRGGAFRAMTPEYHRICNRDAQPPDRYDVTYGFRLRAEPYADGR